MGLIFTFLRRNPLTVLALLLLGTALGAASGYLVSWKEHSNTPPISLGTPLRPGPWGEIYYTPFNISAPEELLPIRMIEDAGTHWLFKDCTLSELTHTLDSIEMPDRVRNALLDPAIAHVAPAGIDLTPAPETVIALPSQARQAIYRQLAQFPENRSNFTFIHKSTLADRFDNSGLSHETLELFRTLCCEHGDYLVFGGLPAMLAQLPAYEEKVHFMKALTRQKTMLLRVKLTRESDLATLQSYWARGPWSANTRTILESLIQGGPGDAFMTVLTLLPPRPASQLYEYPISRSASLDAASQVRDCHWTSLNFFGDPEREQPVDRASFPQLLAEHFYPLSGDPRYGDLLILAKPDGEIIHSAVFIADDIVYTKNGTTAFYPWMFATIPDLLKQYSFLAPDGQQLTLRYFRNKEL